jgi:hypothetical protein
MVSYGIFINSQKIPLNLPSNPLELTTATPLKPRALEAKEMSKWFSASALKHPADK